MGKQKMPPAEMLQARGWVSFRGAVQGSNGDTDALRGIDA